MNMDSSAGNTLSHMVCSLGILRSLCFVIQVDIDDISVRRGRFFQVDMQGERL